mgnify:CR=1 FL=1
MAQAWEERFHKLDRAKDSNFWSVRVNADIRIIVHRTAASILLVYVDHHDDGAAHVDKAHPHFVCDECGDVQCLPEEIVELHATRSTPKSLRGREVEIQLKGRCDRCT